MNALMVSVAAVVWAGAIIAAMIGLAEVPWIKRRLASESPWRDPMIHLGVMGIAIGWVLLGYYLLGGLS